MNRPNAEWRARAVWTVCLLATALVAASLLLDVPERPREGLSLRLGRFAYLGIALPTSLVGGIIVTHRPGNRIGIMMISAGFLIAADQTTWNYYRYGRAHSLPLTESAGLLANWLWVCPVILLLWTLLLYPDGSLPSPRWRPLAWIYVVWSALLATLAGLGAGVYSEPPLVPLPWSQDLFGHGSNLEHALPGLFAAFPALVTGSAAAVIVRLQQAGREERSQIKWLAFVGGVVVAVWSFPPTHETGSWARVGANLMLWAVPTAIGAAVLRYHLYDIGRVINRTLVYALLTVCISGAYILIVTSLGMLFQHTGIGASAVVATVIAVLAAPVRTRLQRGVNRLLYGGRGEPYAVVSELGRRLSAVLAPGSVLPVIVSTVASALKLPYVAVQLLQDGEFRAASVHGVASTHTLTIPLTHHGELLGRIVLGPRSPGEEFSPAELRLLHDLARQAGLALHGVRLTADLQRSRERLVTAREEERRRLRRDLHDGLGPTLAGVAYLLDGARLSALDDARAAPMLDALRTEIRGAIAEVRRLLDGLGSAALDELGLLRAIEARAELLSTAPGGHSGPVLGTASARSGPRTGGIVIEVRAPKVLPHLPPAIEVAAYRIVTEALTNVVRHSGAAHCQVVLELADDGSLNIEITDDGHGLTAGEGLAGGVGLTSMRERAAELGGSCTVGQRSVGGTRVAVHLPSPGRWTSGFVP